MALHGGAIGGIRDPDKMRSKIQSALLRKVCREATAELVRPAFSAQPVPRTSSLRERTRRSLRLRGLLRRFC